MSNKESMRKLVREVLEKGYLISLATVDEHGVWVCDVIYVFDDALNIYWLSDPETRHSRALEKKNKVAGTITVSGPREDNLGIQFEGTAGKITGARFDLVKKHWAKRGKPLPKETDDVLQGDAWYTLKPETIDVIHEKLFGFEKQKLVLE